MLFKKRKKNYWKKAIIYGRSSSFACDLILPIPLEVKYLYSDEEWNDILEMRKKHIEKTIQQIKSLLEELDQKNVPDIYSSF